jgi:hypothetical protein
MFTTEAPIVPTIASVKVTFTTFVPTAIALLTVGTAAVITSANVTDLVAPVSLTVGSFAY